MDQHRVVRLHRVGREVGEWREQPADEVHRRRGGSAVEDYEAVFDRASRRLGGWLSRLAAERQRAAGQLRRLQGRPPQQQVFLLLNLDLRRSFSLAAMLLESALRQVYLDPRRAHHLARLAKLVNGRLDLVEYGPDLVSEISCRGWAVWGHTSRILGRLGSAMEAFHQARRLLSQSSGEPLEEGFLLDLEASLWATRERWEKAAGELRRARRCFERVGDGHLAGRAGVKSGVVALLAGRPTRAAGLLAEGLAHLDPRRDPYAATVGEALLAALRLETRRLDDRLEAQRRLRRARSRLVCPPAEPVRPLVERVARRFEMTQEGPLLTTWPRRL